VSPESEARSQQGCGPVLETNDVKKRKVGTTQDPVSGLTVKVTTVSNKRGGGAVSLHVDHITAPENHLSVGQKFFYGLCAIVNNLPGNELAGPVMCDVSGYMPFRFSRRPFVFAMLMSCCMYCASLTPAGRTGHIIAA